MKQVQYNKNNNTYVIRLTSEELSIIISSIRQLTQTNKTIALFDELNEIKKIGI